MTALLEIIKGGTLSVRYQAIIQPHNGSFSAPNGAFSVHAYEALARGPKGTNLERADVMFEYVRLKHEESAVDAFVRRWRCVTRRCCPHHTFLSINVHASTLVRDRNFVPDLLRMAEGFDLSPARLILEILEHTPMLDGAMFHGVLQSLRAEGVRIALDDIGHHGANYQMILDCRPDYFKLDRYFVRLFVEPRSVIYSNIRDGGTTDMIRSLAVAILLLSRVVSAEDAIQIEPADPTSTTPVTLIVMEVDSCPPPPVVTRSGFTITVALGVGPCLSPAILITYRLELGILAAGEYQVVVTDGGEPAGSASFDVLDANTSVIVRPSLGRAAGGTVVDILTDVNYCPDWPQTCTPPAITFGGVAATNVTAVDGTHFQAPVPAHAPGAVEVRVAGGPFTRSSYAFRYYDPAAPPLPALFERVLFPVVYKGPGAFGSAWMTELTLKNSNAYAVEPWRAIGDLTSLPPAEALSFEPGSAPAGVFVILPRESAPAIHFNALVRDLSREPSAWGAEVPVVRENDFRSTPIDLLNIPTDPRFRLTLRMYALGSVPAFVQLTFYAMDGGGVLHQSFVDLVSAAPCMDPFACGSDRPSYAAISDLQSLLGSAGRIGIDVEPLSGLPVWAFVTITNNDTQHVTVISPQ